MILSNVRIDSVENGKADWVSRKIPEVPKSYPEAHDFGRLPSYGVYCRHVTGLRLRNVEFTSGADEARPAIVCDDVKNLDTEGLRSKSTAGTQPVIKLIQTRQAFIRGCCAPTGAKTFLEVQGDSSDSVVLNGNNLLGAEQAIQTGTDVSQTAVTTFGNVVRT